MNKSIKNSKNYEYVIKEVQNNDYSNFSVLIQEFKPLIYSRASYYHTDGAEVLDDFIQEGIIALFRSAVTFDKDYKVLFSTYATQCINNALIDLSQKKDKKHTYSLEEFEEYYTVPFHISSTEHSALGKKGAEDFIRCYQFLLSPYEIRVLRLHLEELTYLEIADKLETTTKSIDNALQRIRRKLRPNTLK